MSEMDKADKLQNSSIASIPFVAQIDSSDCGAACLSMVAQFFKKDLMLSEARQLCGSDISGQGLSLVAQKVGIQGRFIKKSFPSALKASLPLIAHWESDHWVVIAGVKDGKVKIADPASGIYWLNYDEAEKAYSDYCLTVSCESAGSHSSRTKEHVLLKCLRPFSRALMAAAAIMLVIIGIEMFIPYIFQQIIDEEMVAGEQSFQWLITYSVMASIVVIISFSLMSYILYKGAVNSENLVLNALLSKWVNLPNNFYRGRSFSELRARMESAFEIKRLLLTAAGSGLFSLLEIIAVFAMLEYYGFALKFAFMLLPSLIMTFYTLYLSRESAGLFKFANDSFLNRIDDITRGVFSIRAAAATKKFKNIQLTIKEEMYERTFPLERKLIICEKGAQALGIAAWILLFFQTCKSYVDGDISSGVMFAVIILAAMALNALSRIIGKREKFENVALIYEYLNDVLDTKGHLPKRLILKASSSVIISDQQSCKFEVQRGEKAVLAGPAAIKVVQALTDNDKSPFKISLKVDNKVFEAAGKLPQISVMEENAHLFNMSLVDNVTLGEEVNIDKVKWCLRLACADGLVDDLPQGLATKITDNALKENEAKKLLLARCLYRDRPLYLLTNLSTFLNCRERLIFSYHLKKHLQDKTVLILNAEQELLPACDKGAVFIGAQIKECGTVEELIKMEKSFYSLYNV